jgi:RNA polymerase sigma-70 factor (ECF subfamily)
MSCPSAISPPCDAAVADAAKKKPATWLGMARQGSTEALGCLLESYRTYLTIVARSELQNALLPKVGASDIVQDAFLKAYVHFDSFRGASRSEFASWLRRILLMTLANVARDYRDTARRDIARETSLGTHGEELVGISPQSSPSRCAMAAEQIDRLARALDSLPPHYRQVLQWRNLEQRPFGDIANRMGKSVDATRMLWVRAFKELQAALDALGEGDA